VVKNFPAKLLQQLSSSSLRLELLTGPYFKNVPCIYLRTNGDLCHLQHKMIDFYNRDEKCLQRGMDWVFK